MLGRSYLILLVVLAGLMLAACGSMPDSREDVALDAGLEETEAPPESPALEETDEPDVPPPATEPAESIECVDVNPHPVGSAIAEQFDVPYEEIMGWYCAGYGFGEISIAYSLAAEHDMPVEDVFALYAELMDWGEVERELASEDEPEATEEPGEDDQAAVCTGADPHPAGMALAEQYDVPYEEIMSWFCAGFGFGEIDLAYSLSLESGLPVDAVFAMKAGGMGWGQIKHELEDVASQPGGGGPPLGHGNPHTSDNDDHPGNSGNPPGNPHNNSGGNGNSDNNPGQGRGHNNDDDQGDD
jgi:hypothetical protein